MFRIVRIFFVSMGITFTLLLCGVAYLFIADPFHIRSIITLLLSSSPAVHAVFPTEAPASARPTTVVASTTVPVATTSTVTAVGPTSAQREALQAVGIDPQTVVSKITPTQLACFMSVLGAARVAEIKGGAVPSAAEFIRVRSCL